MESSPTSNDTQLLLPQEKSRENTICRYCMEENATLFPCDCHTPIHKKCLQKWSNTRNISDIQKCEICQTKYDVKIVIIKSNHSDSFESHEMTVESTICLCIRICGCICCMSVLAFNFIVQFY